MSNWRPPDVNRSAFEANRHLVEPRPPGHAARLAQRHEREIGRFRMWWSDHPVFTVFTMFAAATAAFIMLIEAL